MGERVNPCQCRPSTACFSEAFSFTSPRRLGTSVPDNSQIGVSLHNSLRNFIVTGPPRAPYGLVAKLRKICAPNGSDQSKV